MGILNVTPDSFSDGGRYTDLEAAVEHVKAMVAAGADLIDIGGESTRPGSVHVPEEEEIRRVIPIIEALREAVSVPLSIDTYKPGTAKRALEAGAHLLNDIWGCRRDSRMGELAAEYGCPIILMHNRPEPVYADFLADVVSDLEESVRIAKRAGVRDEQIILDPGIGFAKSQEQNLQLLGNLKRLTALGYPVLLAASRKRTLRNVLDLPADDVIEGTVATTVLGIAQGCELVRVHDIKENARAARMADAIVRCGA
ncbi:dihydropteroate synthase [Gorillibacterium timonense]|uniref:dihydropteroate synthase n=1 Tax=Gorillibacterium timonense TaxID=1689269 RepID=UPI001F2B9A7A|nr:dihydropteroate synthase [Gorillibacterium timonense]